MERKAETSKAKDEAFQAEQERLKALIVKQEEQLLALKQGGLSP